MQALETAAQVIKYEFSLSACSDDWTQDESEKYEGLVSTFEEEAAVMASEAGATGEHGYCPEAYTEMLLDDAYGNFMSAQVDADA